jgi:hypothetical protein
MWAGAKKVVQRFHFCLNVEKYPRESLGDSVIVQTIDQTTQLEETIEGTVTLVDDGSG